MNLHPLKRFCDTVRLRKKRPPGGNDTIYRCLVNAESNGSRESSDLEYKLTF